MKLFKPRQKVAYRQGRIKSILKVAPEIDIKEDEYRGLIRMIADFEGVEEPLELRMGLKELHQLTLNLYITCRRFNLPIDNPTAEKARQFWGMGAGMS